MSRAKVVVADTVVESTEHEQRILGEIADVVAVDAVVEDALWGHVDDADALMFYHPMLLTDRTIGRMPKCRIIIRCGVGYDNVDIAAARRRGIPVANVPDYGTEEVADSAIGCTLALTRGIYRLGVRMRDRRGPWVFTEGRPLHRLRGRTFGVIGLGRIGTATALRAKALGMDVVFFDPYVVDGRDKAIGIRRAESLADLLSQSFVVSLHCPLTPETRHLIDAKAIAAMPKGSFLVNTARGAVADVMAVLDGISTGHLAGAALDVLEWEPPPDDHPLLVAWRDPTHPAYERLIITPHVAFYAEEGLADMRIKGSENARRVLLGGSARNVVN